MAKLYGAQKMVLQEILNVQGETTAYVEDSRLSQSTQIAPGDVRNWLLTLDQEEYVDLALTSVGISASITPKGRLALGLYRPPRRNPPLLCSWSRRGREARRVGSVP